MTEKRKNWLIIGLVLFIGASFGAIGGWEVYKQTHTIRVDTLHTHSIEYLPTLAVHDTVPGPVRIKYVPRIIHDTLGDISATLDTTIERCVDLGDTVACTTDRFVATYQLPPANRFFLDVTYGDTPTKHDTVTVHTLQTVRAIPEVSFFRDAKYFLFGAGAAAAIYGVVNLVQHSPSQDRYK
jgi:hypothetical protein